MVGAPEARATASLFGTHFDLSAGLGAHLVVLGLLALTTCRHRFASSIRAVWWNKRGTGFSVEKISSHDPWPSPFSTEQVDQD